MELTYNSGQRMLDHPFIGFSIFDQPVKLNIFQWKSSIMLAPESGNQAHLAVFECVGHDLPAAGASGPECPTSGPHHISASGSTPLLNL